MNYKMNGIDIGDKGERGQSILAAMIAITLAALVVATLVNRTIGNTKVNVASNQRLERFYEAESSMGKGISWIRDNSASMVGLFNATQFDTYFERATPSVGSNDVEDLAVPTQIKLKGTSDSAILSTSDDIGPTSFPDLAASANNDEFRTAQEFANSSFGKAKVKMTLVDATQSSYTAEDALQSGPTSGGGSGASSGSGESDDEGADSGSDSDDHNESDGDDGDHGDSDDHGESDDDSEDDDHGNSGDH